MESALNVSPLSARSTIIVLTPGTSAEQGRNSTLGARATPGREPHDGRALSRELNLAVRNWKCELGLRPRLRLASPERFVSEDAERAAGGEMALDVEGVEDYGVNRQESLG